MFKKLLYLYNDGHNPFPTGRGGLGYHLPQYPKLIHGGTLSDEESEEESEDESEILEDADPSTNEGRKIILKELIEELEGKDIKRVEDTTLKNITDVLKLEPKNLNIKKLKGIQKSIDKVDKLLTTPSPSPPPPHPPPPPPITTQNEVKEEIPQVKEKKKTQKEIKAEQKDIKSSIENILYEKGFKKNTENKKVSKSILDNLPNLTLDEFNNNPDKYLNMYYNNKFEKIEKMEAIKKAVTEEHGQGETDTKGHAAEIVLLRDYQNDIKELTGSTDPDDIISLSSNSDGFKNDEGIVPTVRWFNPNTKHYEDKDISHFSLFDADGKNASIDLKYYQTEDVDVQFSKINGNYENIPLYREINGQIKLYNVVNKTTKKLINKHNDTDTYIVAKTPETIASWKLTKFIKDNINKDNEIKNIKYNGIDCFIIEPSFMERMITEKKVKKGKTHTGNNWFSINTKKMNKK